MMKREGLCVNHSRPGTILRRWNYQMKRKNIHDINCIWATHVPGVTGEVMILLHLIELYILTSHILFICHLQRVKAAMAVLDLEGKIPITMLIDDAEKASKGGWILPKPSSDDMKANIAEELVTGDLAGVYNYCYRDILPEGERYKGRCTAPLLIDTRTGTIVTNESNEIMILLNDYARRLPKHEAIE